MKRITQTIFLLMIMPVSSYTQSNNIGPGISLEFNGDAASYVDIGDVYNTLNFPVTFESWVYPTAFNPVNGVMASDNDNAGNYYGLHVNMYPSGIVAFEIGDGTGAGSTDRRGKKTTSGVSLNTWTHLAIVATSITDIKFYFNGILQPTVNTDGTSPATNILHSSKIGTIGRTASVHGSSPFTGEMEDVRLWSVARTETEVRSNMCHKLLGTETNLIGYWNADGPYAGTDVNDLTVPSENGTIVGTVSKITSSAPIGDISVYQYVADWSGITLSLSSPGGDKLKINKIVNTPSCVHLYRVDSAPYYTGGLDIATDYYYGVFTGNGLVPAKYTATYLYSMSNGAVTVENEVNAALFAKNDAAKLNWSNAGATLNITSDKLTKKNSSSRKEFIFNTYDNVNPRLAGPVTSLNLYPNPASDNISLSNVAINDRICITDISGTVVRNIICDDIESVMKIDVSDLHAGVYIVTVFKTEDITSYKLIKYDD